MDLSMSMSEQGIFGFTPELRKKLNKTFFGIGYCRGCSAYFNQQLLEACNESKLQIMSFGDVMTMFINFVVKGGDLQTSVDPDDHQTRIHILHKGTRLCELPLISYLNDMIADPLFQPDQDQNPFVS